MPGNSAFTLDTMVRFIADEQSIAAVNRSISTIKNFARTALGAIGVGFSLRELNRMTESYRSMKNEMAAVFGSTEELAAVQEKVKKTARDVSGEYEKIAENVTDLVKNNKRVFDVDTANRFTDVMWKLTKMSGGNNATASAAVQSLSSAMRNGKIDRGAIDQLINNVPQAVKVLTSYYGVTQEKLRSMAQAGLIRSAQIRDAFLQAGEDIDKAFGDTQMNITDVLSSFRSEFTAFIGETDEMLGITKTLSKILKDGLDFLMKGMQKARSGLLWLSDKLGGMENVLKLLAILAGSFFVALHLKDIIAGLTNILGIFTKLGLKGLALVAVIALIALMIDDLVHFIKGDKKTFLGDLLDFKGIDKDGAKDKILGTLETIKKNAERILEEIQIPIKNLIFLVRRFFGGIKRWWDEGGAEDVQASLEKFKDAAIRAWDALKQWMDENMPGLLEMAEEFGQTFGEAFEAALGVLADIFSLLVDLLTEDSENAEKDLQDLTEHLGALLKSLLDLVFGRGFTDNAFDWGHNFIEEFVRGLREGWSEFGEKYFDFLPDDVKKKLGFVSGAGGGTSAHASGTGTAHSGIGGSFGDGEDIYKTTDEKGGVTIRLNDEGAGHSGSKGSFDNRTFGQKLSDAWDKIQNSWWFKNSAIGGAYTGLKTLGLFGKDEESEEVATLLHDASRSLENSAAASGKTASQTTNDSYNKTQNNEINVTNNMYGDAATKNVYDNVTRATDDSMDTITRSLVAANGG